MEKRLNIIAIDVGNTSTAVCKWSDGRIECVRHCDKGFEEAAMAVRRILEEAGGEIAAIGYSSVVPEVDAKWKRFAAKCKLDFVAVNAATFKRAKLPVTLCYNQVETIGADRLADAAGAADRYGSGILVMDFGTAFTAAIITADGKWRGGVIAPGFPLMRDYLFERTAKLPAMPLGGKAPKIGKSTLGAMKFGAIVGYRGMIKEIVAELEKNFGAFRHVATGGYAKWALKDIDMEVAIDPTLTLYGVGLICSRNLR